MYYSQKKFEVSVTRRGISKCDNSSNELFRQFLTVTVYCKSSNLGDDEKIYDFDKINEVILDTLDNNVLDDVLPFVPTLENIARFIVDSVPCCHKASIQDQEGMLVVYTKDSIK